VVDLQSTALATWRRRHGIPGTLGNLFRPVKAGKIGLLAGLDVSFYDIWQNLTGLRNVMVVTNMPVLIGNCRLDLPVTLPQF
jgi:hypothetical protein